MCVCVCVLLLFCVSHFFALIRLTHTPFPINHPFFRGLVFWGLSFVLVETVALIAVAVATAVCVVVFVVVVAHFLGRPELTLDN